MTATVSPACAPTLRILAFAGWLAAGGCGGDGSTRVCFGSTEFCAAASHTNRAPVADAGADFETGSGDPVTLDGRVSRDPDGTLASFSWTQQDGPAVTLTDADRVIARFTPPAVTDATDLSFRLVVVDDDGASDSDVVRVTVTPGAASALLAGIRLLDGQYPPPLPGPGEAACPSCWSYLGLWLGARSLTAASGLEGDVTGLLDRIRTLPQLVPDRHQRRALDSVQGRLLDLGLAQLASFAEQRDPAIADGARSPAAVAAAGRAPQTGSAPVAAAWRLAIAAADSRWREQSPAAAEQRAIMLLLATARTRRDQAASQPAATQPPQAIAAATLLLALAASEGRHLGHAGYTDPPPTDLEGP